MRKTQKKLSKPTVTVAVCAYNEEKNIKNFLESVLAQKEEKFILQNIWVYSDGSTDKTVDLVRSFKSKKIKIFDDRKRLGKSSRLNQVYLKLESDILVQSDADVVFAHPNVVREIIKPLLTYKEVGICGGRPLPIHGKTFTEKAINVTCEVYDGFRRKVRGGNNVFSADGRLLAFKKELVKKIMIPSDMIANDAFTYFKCLSLGFKYKYVEKGVVYFRSPQTIEDQIRQNTRFLSAPARMAKYFPQDMVKREYDIPKALFIKELIKKALQHPVLSAYILLINRYCQIKANLIEKRLNALWSVAYTTKTFK